MKYNFTLIIPTHNRHSHLERSIKYYNSLEAEVIYCDSTENKYEGELGKNMKYIHLKGKRFAEKINIALENVTTDYVALCADDDFILRESLYKGVWTLEENDEFKTVVGKYVAFNDKFDGNFFKIYQDLPLDINFDKKTNVKMFFSNYYQILWAMYNKEILVDSFTIIEKAKYKNDNFIEITLGSVICNYGGIKYLDNIWGVRELSSKDHWGKRHKGLENIFFDNNIKNDFKNYKLHLDNLSFKGYAILVLKTYLKSYYRKTIILSSLNIIKKIIPINALKKVRYFYSSKYKKSSIKSKEIEATKLSSEVQLQLEDIRAILNELSNTE